MKVKHPAGGVVINALGAATRTGSDGMVKNEVVKATGQNGRGSRADRDSLFEGGSQASEIKVHSKKCHGCPDNGRLSGLVNIYAVRTGRDMSFRRILGPS